MGEVVVGRVAEIWRYPVKSLGGERLDRVGIGSRGVDLDRLWALRGRDGKLGSGKNTKRFRRMSGLLGTSSRISSDGVILVRLADGSEMELGDPASAAAFSSLVGEEVEFAAEGGVSHLDDSPVHLVATSSLAWLSELMPGAAIQARRFRPNLVIEVPASGRQEESWVGRGLRIGEVELRVHKPTERCVMTTMEQPGLRFEPSILRTLERENSARLGVYATVETPGTCAEGDEVVILG
ncbi:MAG: MOSC domain-containing protein [Actinomycetota bacterium]|nr:MOSC domain-containing protein [Actinomycetota bacterium]